MRYKYDFDDKKSFNKKKIVFVVLILSFSVILSAFLFRNNSNKIIGSISNVILKPFVYVYNFSTSIFKNLSVSFADKEKITNECEALKKENEELKLELLESQRIIDENASLKQMLDIKKAYQHFNIEMSNIIYREHDNWSKTFKINVGEKNGIKINQAVVDKNGLVGFISSVEGETSTVTTILDPSVSISVKINGVNEPAILKGDLDLKSKNLLKLEFIELDANISISDMVYTSGIGNKYPASIPIGKITEIVNSKNDINRYAIIEPSVNIKKLNEVGVIKN